ncbi:MAG: isoprenylcysteine carboxylmethyltransferase family protein [Chloroflexi bacterium]|nr:isoprenylcysteine carboxylmethyltransferase family protein [Chloroflexota bacterium]
MSGPIARLRRFVGSTPRRTFVLYPALVIGVETARRGSLAVPRPAFLALLAWGYLQYRLVGEYRVRVMKAGGWGFDKPPDRLIEVGPYAYTRNPMYLGHLIFLLGLALGFRSLLGWLILLANLPWFHARVLADEARLRQKFGAEYEAYCARVKRWIPSVL